MTKPEKITWILFAIVVVALYLFALDLPLLGPDEPRYSQVAREMFERGDWVTTTLGGFNWFEKPALLYWLQISFYNLFGVSEFAARLGSALFGLGTIGSLFWVGRVVVGTTRVENNNTGCGTENPEAPFWIALVAASSIGLIAFSRGASFDIILTFPIAASLVSFFIWEVSSSKPDARPFFNCLIAFYFFIGIALIAKGLVGIVFPIAIVSFYYVLRWKFPHKTLLYSLFWGTLLSIAVASIWYLPVYLRNGWEFVDEFFIQHHFQRFSSNKFKHPQPFWFFWVVLPAMTIPWIPFFLIAAWKTIKEIVSGKEAKGQSEDTSQITHYKFSIASYDLRVFAFAWMLVPLVFFSLSGSKLPGYILPSLPAACILTGLAVSRFVRNSDRRKFGLQMLAFLTVVVVAFLLQFSLPKFAENDSIKGLIEAANSSGYKNEKIVNFRTVSHSVEFYGANRLFRTRDGKQRRFDNVGDLRAFMKEENLESVLAIVPKQFLNDFSQNESVEFKPVAENEELAVISITQNEHENY